MNRYELLGVSSSADNEELRKAFRNLSKELHPDTTSLPYEVAVLKFQKICEAYDFLSDPVSRANYDAYLIQQGEDNAKHYKAEDFQQLSHKEFKLKEFRRPLSGGELFSIVLFFFALLISLLLGIGFSLVHGREWLVTPSWLIVNLMRII